MELKHLLGLKYEADVRTVLFAAVYFLFSAFQWYIDVTAKPLLVRIFFFLATCQLSFSGAVCVHNFIHCPMFYNKYLNRIFQVYLSLWYGSTAAGYVPGHNLSHHKHLQTRKDYMRTYRVRNPWNLINLFTFFPIVVSSNLNHEKAYFDTQKKKGKYIYTQMTIEMTCFWTLQILLGGLNFSKYIWIVFLPQLFAKYGIVTINLLQHDGCNPDDKYNHSRNFVDDFLNFMTFNNGYHGIHHMYPGKHWSLLKDAHAKIVHPHIHPNLECDSIFGYLFKSYVYPGVRLDYKGDKWVLPEDGPDQAWNYAQDETYSSEVSD